VSWDELLGQEAAVRYLRRTLSAGRFAHGCLLEGPQGVGKRTAAVVLARVLLCHNPPAPDEACGECKSCRWLRDYRGGLSEHPDLVILWKNPNDQVGSRPLRDEEALIPLETMQYLSEQLHRAPRSGPRRVALIPEAHRMCGGQAEAANAFLKTLEEPPATSVLILTSSRPEALLETMVSRLQPVRLRRLSSEAIREGLVRARRTADDPSVALAVAMADGSLGRAKEMLDGALGRWRAALLKELGQVNPLSCPRFGLALWTLAEEEGERLFEESQSDGTSADEGAEKEGEEEGADEETRKTAAGWKRYVFLRLLELCEAAFRDGLLAAAGAGNLSLLTGPEGPLAEKLAKQFGAAGCERVLEFLRDARRANRLYVRGDLIGRVLAGRMVEHLRA
jgi:DNA polymerase-3 subunit delta'